MEDYNHIEEAFDDNAEIKIEVCRRADGKTYHAQLIHNDQRKGWAVGNSLDDAIGYLVRQNWQELGVGLKWLPNTTR